MFNYKISFFFLIVLLGFISCQDVVEVDLPETESRLVVDAIIRVPDTGSSLVNTSIRLTLTASFYADSVPKVTDAIINLNTSSTTYRLRHDGNGYYSAAIPRTEILQDSLALIIFYKDEIYRSTATYIPAVAIDGVTQGESSLFTGDETEVIIAYTDAPSRSDYYLFDLDLGQFLVSEDTFYEDQQFAFSYFYEDLEPQDTLNIVLIGITKPFFDYMSVVINQSGEGSGNPFAAPPSELRGNISNETDENHYPLGYFAIGQVYSSSLIIE